MKTNIKLIWDFHGPDAEHIARHHAVHLEEFAQKEGLPYSDSGIEERGKDHHLAYIVIDQEHMITFRDALRPHRGLRVS